MNKFTSKYFYLMMLCVHRNNRGTHSASYNTINLFRDKLQAEGVDYDLGHLDFKNFIARNPNGMSYWGGRIHVTVTDDVLDKYADTLARFEFEYKQCIEWWKAISEGNVGSTYTPNPIDTSGVVLTEDLHELVEKLAENAHDCWAEERIKNGWVYGEKRCDEKKQHPCLVPYCLLTDEEKEYDRILSINTIKVLLSLGYKITLA